MADVTELDRRTVLLGFAALGVNVAAAGLATSPVRVGVVADHEIERLRIWIGQLFDALRAEGIAVVRPPNGGGALVFWLQDDDDLTTMQLVELTEDVFL
jgi:hypothetical protein